MALKLTLKPGERVAINGAVIVNGERRAIFVVENQARVLREGDILQPENADTPAKRIYLPIMMIYLDPATRDEMQPEYEQRLTEFTNALTNPEALRDCVSLAAHMANDDCYKALTICQRLIEYEKTRLANVA